MISEYDIENSGISAYVALIKNGIGFSGKVSLQMKYWEGHIELPDLLR